MAEQSSFYDTIIIGAGAAGMMCAAHAGARGGRVLVIEHGAAPGEKIRISGGGRCNFTNLDVSAKNFLSENPHFCKSALGRYTQHDFIGLVTAHGIAWHEKSQGQLFCDGSARQIIDLLIKQMHAVHARLWLQSNVLEINRSESRFELTVEREGRRVGLACDALVVATGGKSIPKMGATGFGYRVAEQFDMAVTPTRPALVPFTFSDEFKAQTADLVGISLPAVISLDRVRFADGVLFTHRGLSGPAVLQISSYWREGQSIALDLLPGGKLQGDLRAQRQQSPRRSLGTALSSHLPKKLAAHLTQQWQRTDNLGTLSDKAFDSIEAAIHRWELRPLGTEGYRTAEVTSGGVATDGLDARSLQSKAVPGLYFIGEVVDVTGWLGGYNFQWAWSSGWAAGTAIAERTT
ncbi:MAG: NAD(P)/FAD-dependent oxidoreductase [Neomegalonema sp.]|nr:NAD(P)/FAD-dependent oxidoreductase [Neomegalonema sp.]